MNKQTTIGNFIERIRQLPKSSNVISFELNFDNSGLLRPENENRFTIGQLYESIKDMKNDTVVNSFELVYADKHGYESKIQF